jgi:phosphoribosylformylglycinamidine cyclo-ligase
VPARNSAGLTYKSAGLDLEVYEEAMARLPALMKRTHTARVIDNPGGFAGLFSLFGRGARYTDPVLVTGTDGVGTKLKVAISAGVHNTVGIDLVAMSVNDCLCLGAAPLFFLDYLALPKDDPGLIEQVVQGVCTGCEEAGAALLGGETAVMPDLYQPGDFDLAGFAVSIVERKEIIDGKRIRPKDILVGVASSGFHSNGYSLVRKAVFSRARLKVSQTVPELGTTVGDALLRPTRIYVRPILDLLERRREQRDVVGLAHITGGGLADNLVRILPANCAAVIDRGTWTPPAVFPWVQKLGKIDREEMFRVFNMGIGFVLVVRPAAVDAVRSRLKDRGFENWVIGSVSRGEQAVKYAN